MNGFVQDYGISIASALEILQSCTKSSMYCLLPGGNVMCIHTWGRDSGPYMQALHFSFGLGAFVSPLIAEPFLGHPVNHTELANLSLPSQPTPDDEGVSKRRAVRSWDVDISLPYVINNQHRKTRDTGKNETGPAKPGMTIGTNPNTADGDILKELKDQKSQEEPAEPEPEPDLSNSNNTSSTAADMTSMSTTSISTTSSTTTATITTTTTTTPTTTTMSTHTPVILEGSTNANGTSSTADVSTVGPSVTQRVLVTLRSLTKVQFAYLTVALFVLLVGITFLCLCCSALCGSAPLGQCHMPSEYHIHKESRGFRVQLLLLLFAFYFLYVGMEVTYGGLIMSFAVDYLHWSKEQGTLLTSVFWGCFAASRGLAVFLARCLSPTLMLITDLALTGLALAGLLLTIDHNASMAWYCTAALGAGMASIFPTGITWAERYMHVGSKAAAVFVVGSALGEMALPALTGLLFGSKGPMWLIYIMLGCALTSMVIYILLQNLASGKGERYQRLNNLLTLASALDDSHEMDKVVTTPGYAENGQVRKTVTFDLPDTPNGSPQTKSVGRAKYTLLKSNEKKD